VTPHPKLPGTIATACKEIEEAGGKAFGSEKEVEEAVKKAVEVFGGIDILINNASAISLTDTTATDMKR
jgi:NAD(P)-dependent dehydrogenase (short-subunit alcohol dehydrogenase family)